jgi:cell division protein FtsB
MANLNKYWQKLKAGRLGAHLQSLYRRTRVFRVVATLFVVFMLFFDENSVLQNFRYRLKIMELNKEIDSYRKIIDESKRKLGELNSDPESLEKFAREQLLMKKDNEDVYLIDK